VHPEQGLDEVYFGNVSESGFDEIPYKKSKRRGTVAYASSGEIVTAADLRELTRLSHEVYQRSLALVGRSRSSVLVSKPRVYPGEEIFPVFVVREEIREIGANPDSVGIKFTGPPRHR